MQAINLIGVTIANAGPDQSASFYVPIILDGSSSAGGTNFFWKQISGTRIEIIGQDRSVAMLLSSNVATVATFRLQVDDTVTTNTDDVVITIINSAENVMYVDNLLSANTSTYSIQNRNGSGSDGNAFTNIQSAVNNRSPGDTIYVRDGTFQNVKVSGVFQSLCKITNSGTATLPIRIINYPGEHPKLVGLGYSDADDGTGQAVGPADTSKTEELVYIQADYVQVSGFDIGSSQTDGILIDGSNFVYIADCYVHDNWKVGINPASNITNAIIKGIVLR